MVIISFFAAHVEFATVCPGSTIVILPPIAQSSVASWLSIVRLLRVGPVEFQRPVIGVQMEPANLQYPKHPTLFGVLFRMVAAGCPFTSKAVSTCRWLSIEPPVQTKEAPLTTILFIVFLKKPYHIYLVRSIS